jgi:hypothetical protein
MAVDDPEVLYAELGRFVVEFEGLLQRTKDLIKEYFHSDQLFDVIPVEVLMYDSTSAPIAKYYQAISLHHLEKTKPDRTEQQTKVLKGYINSIATKIGHVGELRNDIVHASWGLSSIYGRNNELDAERIKVTADGLLVRKLSVEPGIMNDSIEMINHLAHFMSSVTYAITNKDFPFDETVLDTEIEAFKNINFPNERNKLFVDDPDHYKWQLERCEEMKKITLGTDDLPDLGTMESHDNK